MNEEAPNDIIWLITGRCNLNCIHCYANMYRSERELSTTEVLKIVKDATDAGVEHIHYTGGEPLLRRDMIQILKETIDLGLYATLFTNLTIINQDIARELSRLGIVIYTSLDGHNRELYEAHRGRGTWDRFLKGFNLIKEEGLHIHVNISITEINWNYVGSIISKAIEIGAESVSIIPAMPSGNAMRNNVYVKPEHFIKALEDANAKAKELGITIWVWCAPFVGVIFKSPYIRYSNCRYWEVMDISPSGRVILCDVLNYEICNVKELGIRKAWHMFKEHPLMKKIMRPNLKEPCNRCPLNSYCKGGCYARAYIKYGSVEMPDPLCPIVAGLKTK